jgi:glycosyltransferase involved in cell wall biosynthesis
MESCQRRSSSRGPRRSIRPTRPGPPPTSPSSFPAWNEGENLERLLPALREVLDQLGVRAQVVVADGGSTDRTVETAARWGAQVVRQSEPGYGGALLAGFAVAVAPYVVTMDADLSHRPFFLEALWRHRHDAEILIASRYVPGGRPGSGLVRHMLSVVLNRIYARALSTPFRDLSSGFRMYRRDVLVGLPIVSRSFDVLQVRPAALADSRVDPLPCAARRLLPRAHHTPSPAARWPTG